jgi:Raf kinase inhibitor-like YbhB/YbcL family protein
MRIPTAAVLASLLVALATRAAVASSMAVDSSAFLNGGSIPSFDSASTGGCHGRNVSPPLRVTGVPPAAQSLAVVMFDPDANAGAGYVHWVAYGIVPHAGPPLGTTAFPPGFGTAPGPYVAGRNDAGTDRYSGPCPPLGDPAHHYVFTVYALALASTRLPAGLTRTAFLRATAGHALAVGTLTASYGR